MCAEKEMQTKEELTRSVKDYALETLGADLVGIASADDPHFVRAPKGHHPTELVEGAKSVVVLGIRQMKETVSHPLSEMHSKHYDLMNIWLEEASYRMARKLKDMDFSALFIPETDPYEKFLIQRNAGYPRFHTVFCHIHAAVAAGLGRRGKIGVVLTPQFGPLQRWTSIITTADLTPDPKIEGEICLDFIKPGTCRKCVDACPSASLRAWPEEGGVQMYKCAHNNGKLGRGVMCANCLAACPVGR